MVLEVINVNLNYILNQYMLYYNIKFKVIQNQYEAQIRTYKKNSTLQNVEKIHPEAL